MKIEYNLDGVDSAIDTLVHTRNKVFANVVDSKP